MAQVAGDCELEGGECNVHGRSRHDDDTLARARVSIYSPRRSIAWAIDNPAAGHGK
jgi:hypothetical protein